MSANDALFIAIGILMLLFGLGWGLAGKTLGLSRTASLRWMGFCLSSAVAAAAGALDSVVPTVVETGVRNACMVLAFMLLHRGALGFLRLPPRPAGHRLLFGLVLLAPLAEAAGLLPAALRSSAVAALLCWLAASAGAAFVKPVRREFGRVAMGVIAAPMLGAAALFAWRAAWALSLWLQHGAFPASKGLEPALLVALLTLAIVFNLALFFLVLTRLTRQLRHLAARDPLTNLLNRRTTMQALHAEQLRLQRGGESCVVLAVDVDHFKRVNDTHGHAVGDDALRLLAQVLKGSLRDTDLAGRMGGEEFLLLLRMTDLTGAMRVAQRIRDALAAQPLPGVNPPLYLTVSMGAVLLAPGVLQPAEDWLRRADAALYRAKALGRDRVEVAEPTEAAAPRTAPSVPAALPAHA